MVATKAGVCSVCKCRSAARWYKSKFFEGSVCPRCMQEERKSDGNVIVAPSFISGRGLFAVKEFSKGDFITLFSGNEVSPAPRHIQGTSSSRWLSGLGIDEDPSRRMRPATGHYANGESSRRNSNAQFERRKMSSPQDGRHFRAVLVALKHIKAGEEIICCYGSDYFKK